MHDQASTTPNSARGLRGGSEKTPACESKHGTEQIHGEAWVRIFKGGRGQIEAAAPYICGCIRRQPVGCVNAAASGYHYSLDHLLSLEPPAPGRATSSTVCGSSPSRHGSVTQPLHCKQPRTAGQANERRKGRNAGRLTGPHSDMQVSLMLTWPASILVRSLSRKTPASSLTCNLSPCPKVLVRESQRIRNVWSKTAATGTLKTHEEPRAK